MSMFGSTQAAEPISVVNGGNDSISRAPWTPQLSSWLMRYRVLEFSVSIALIVLAGVLSFTPVHMREIPSVEVRLSPTQTVYARDPTLNHKKMREQVSVAALVVGATGAAIAVNLFVNFVLPKFKPVRVIPHDTRDFLLSLLQSVGISQVLTQFVKNLAGRFRPCFYDMCKWNYDVVWDGKTNLCQDKKWEKEARLSFPSGHASYAWCTLFLLTLYLMGRSRLNCETRHELLLRGGRKTLKLFLSFVPTLVATWIAVTRSVDNWHHYTDIVAGSVLGAMAAWISYSYNYGSIFHRKSAGLPLEELHRRRKDKYVIASKTDSQHPRRSQPVNTLHIRVDPLSPPSEAPSDTISIGIK